MSQADPSKTEEATPKRVDKQREEGNVHKSTEVTKALTLIASLALLYALIPFVYAHLQTVFSYFFSIGFETSLNEDTTYDLFRWAIFELLTILAPFFTFLTIVTLITQRVQVGKLWTTKPLIPTFSKLFGMFNPSKILGALKKMVDPSAGFKLFKSVAQAGAVAYAPYIVLRDNIDAIPMLFYRTPEEIAAFMLLTAFKMALYASIIFAVIAIIDYIYGRWKYKDKMKMTKQEITEERKNADGDPRVKMAMKQKMMAIMSQRMMADVPKADVIITNPTHYSIALRYDPIVAPAPLVLAKGVDSVAMRIREIATEHKIPLRQNIPLARALYKQAEIGDTIPEELFQTVATILAQLDRFKNLKK